MSDEVISAVFAALSSLVAEWALRWQPGEQKHRYLLDQASQSLERAYDALTEGQRDSPPVANRFNWLTCERPLERYRAMKADLKHPLYRLIHADQSDSRTICESAIDPGRLVSLLTETG